MQHPVARVSLIELPARFGEQARTLEDLRTLLLEEPRADLALLPEAAITGYAKVQEKNGRLAFDFDLRPLAESIDGPTVESYRSLAEESGTTIAGPLIEVSGESFFNGFVVVSPRGEIVSRYRKRRPWMPETWATRGDLPVPRFEIGGVRFSLVICFDIRFLDEIGATPVLAETDVLLFPSAWVDPGRKDERGPILQEIAREHRLLVANANWGPGELWLQGQGFSRFVGPDGEVARTASSHQQPARIDRLFRRGER